MPIITEDLADMAGVADPRAVVTFAILKPRVSADGSKLIVVSDKSYTPNDAGHLVTDNLEPGPAIVRLGGNPYDVVIPTNNTTLRSMFATAELEPPPAGAEFVASVAGLVGIVSAADLAGAIDDLVLGTLTLDKVTDATAIGKALVRAVDQSAARGVIGAVSMAQVNAAIDALKGNAPAAYDTLVEIADKLGSNDTAMAGLLASIADRYTKSQSDGRYVRTVNGAGPDGTGNVPANDTRIATYEGPFGNGTTGPFQINHGMNTRSFEYTVRRIVPPYDVLDRPYVECPSPNFVIMRPDVAVPAGQYVIGMTGRVGVADVTPPSKPTIALVSKTQTTVVMSGAATDNVAVTAYNWFRDGTYLGTSLGAANFTATGLTPGTAYTGFTCTALDAAGNESVPSNALPSVTTDATPNVAYVDGTGGRAVGANSVQWTHTVAANSGRLMLVFAARSSADWAAASGFTASCTSSLDGALTLLGTVDVGPSGQEAGAIRVYALVNPTVGQHQLTYSDAKSGITNAHTMGNSLMFSGAASVGNFTAGRITAAGPQSVTVPSAVNDMNVWGVLYEGAHPTNYNRTVAIVNGADVAGRGDFLDTFYAPGVATSQAFTSSDSQYSAGIGVRLVKAA